jgi:hypothetical protein
LTAHAIRIHYSKADGALDTARGGVSADERRPGIQAAIRELERMRASLRDYDAHLARLLERRASLAQDFVINPTDAFVDARSAALQQALDQQVPPPGIFAA